MFTRFDANKSTKGASKLRRDLINAEIANLRDLLPLPQSTRQRLSQLQLMALVCVYVRKANYFQQVFKRHDTGLHQTPTPNIGFSKALSGFLMMLTQNGKLLYISDNAAEYLGHSMEDLLIHGDSVYDIIDKQDHNSIQSELGRSAPQQNNTHHHHHHHSRHHNNSILSHMDGEQRMFLCRMNVSRNARRQMRFGDQKVVLIQGHYLSFLPLCSRNEPVFLATCTPIAMPETRECVAQGATNVFTTIHSMDMKIVHIDKNGEFHLNYNKNDLQGISWYQLLHWDFIGEAQHKHRLITQSEQDRSCILLVQMQRRTGEFMWVHVVLQVRDAQESNQQPVIVCTNQVLSEREAAVMLENSWLYQYYSVQSKIQFGLPFEGPTRIPPNPNPYYHHTTTALPPHSYVPHGYHSPVGISGQSASLINNHNGTSNQFLNHHGFGGEHYRPYAYQIETQPVDYSHSQQIEDQQQQPAPVSVSEIRCNSVLTNINNSHITNNRSGSPPAKRSALARLEPLFIPETSQESLENSLTELQAPPSRHISEMGSGHTLILSTVIPTRPRIITKALHLPQNDPTEFMEQWNPSPPWSDTTQKVPDITHQELSPYLTTTPPTPTSAPPHIGAPPIFSFDWMPEQYVPTMDQAPAMSNNFVPVSLLRWPAEHRLLPLPMTDNKTIEDDNNDTREQRRSH